MPLASWLECSEYVYWSDFWEQASCSGSENLKVTLITIAKAIKVIQVVAAYVVSSVEVTPNTLKKLDEI